MRTADVRLRSPREPRCADHITARPVDLPPWPPSPSARRRVRGAPPAVLFERSEEARAVRVGEKETSDQATIVARYADLFSRDQLGALRAAEGSADEADERERIYRLRKTCEGGLIVSELVEKEDALENAELAATVEFRGETMPLRTAQARLAVLPEYGDRERARRSGARGLCRR